MPGLRVLKDFLLGLRDRVEWCSRTDTNECWCRGDQPAGYSLIIPITPEMRTRAVSNALARRRAEGKPEFRLTAGQRRTIVEAARARHTRRDRWREEQT